MNCVYRKQRVEGTCIWGIIHNSYYYLTEMGVYEDGVVNCWEKNDFWQFGETLKRGWVVPAVPQGGHLSIFHLANFQVKEGEWTYDQEGYYQYVESVVRSMNPEMTNLYRTTQREKKKWEDYHTGLLADFVPFRCKHTFGYVTLDGDHCSVFLSRDGQTSLATLYLYEDGTFRIDQDERDYSWEDIQDLFQKGILTSRLEEDSWLVIPGLGRVKVGDVSDIPLEEKLKSIQDLQRKVMTEETVREHCIQVYHEYLEHPSPENREALRKAYEAVPEFERCYLGDMDTRDEDYQRILYSEEKREV